MSNVTVAGADSVGLEAKRPAEKVQPAGGAWYDWVSVITSIWLVGGAYLDGWAHVHRPELESFFTPWHAVIYSGFLAGAAFLVLSMIVNHDRGYPWRRALPAGYELSLVGILIFIVGGFGDMIWHEVFGIELVVEILTSPTHLLLALGGVFIVSGPLRTAWRRPDLKLSKRGFKKSAAKLPAVLSLTLTLSTLTFFTEYAHPFTLTWAAEGHRTSDLFFGQALGVSSIILQSGILMGIVLLAVRRWGPTLPLGSLTIILTLNVSALSLFHDTYFLISAALLAGLASDLLLNLLKPSPERKVMFRLFAFLVPVIVYLFYFIYLILAQDIWWSAHMWVGSIILAGLTGWLISYTFLLPQIEAEQPEKVPTR